MAEEWTTREEQHQCSYLRSLRKIIKQQRERYNAAKDRIDWLESRVIALDADNRRLSWVAGETGKGLDSPVEEMDLSVRAYNVLRMANIFTLRDLVSHKEPEILKYKNCGRMTLEELRHQLALRKLRFGMDYSETSPQPDRKD